MFTDADVHALYFGGYGSISLLVLIVMYMAMKVRKDREGIPMNTKLLTLISGLTAAMFAGVGISYLWYGALNIPNIDIT